MKISTVLLFLASLLICEAALAQGQRLQITSFSVGPDETLTYPNAPTAPNHLVGFPDEHTTIIPPAPGGNEYLVFAASALSGGGPFGAVVLQTTDLNNFAFATALGYNPQVMAPPIPLGQCNPTYNTEFDGNYAAPGSVVQDPTLPAGNLIMLYEAENHCPGGVFQTPFYATVGFARSSDNGETWPSPENGVSGGPSRHPVLQSSDPQPSVPHPYMGDAIPSAFVDKNSNGESYLYVTYSYHTAVAGSNNGLIRVARAKLGQAPLTFLKWYNGSFSQPGIGGLDSGVLRPAGCAPIGAQQYQSDSEISYNDDMGLYLMLYVCVSGPQGAQVGAWYYSTATSLDLQDWAAPHMILNSQFPVTTPCSANGGDQFDGWYPSSMSPGAAAGHTKLTGRAFFLNGCDLGARQFMSRSFTITAAPVPPISSGGIVNNASYAPGTTPLAPGSIAAIFGTNLTDGTSCLPPSCFPVFGSDKKLNTTLAGAQVLINGSAAPIFYASPSQTGVQIPYEATGTSATVAISIAGKASAPVTIPIGPVSPGIFTFTSDGKGAGAITHADGSAVTAQSPAQRGEVVIIYATGLGQVTPAVATGALPTTASNTVAPLTLTIGGINVIPKFAGLAGCCVGLNQINVRVPVGLSPGSAVQVALSIGGQTSNTATIAVQ